MFGLGKLASHSFNGWQKARMALAESALSKAGGAAKDRKRAGDNPEAMPEDIWETAYEEADNFSDLYGCDSDIRYRMTKAFADAILNERIKETETGL